MGETLLMFTKKWFGDCGGNLGLLLVRGFHRSPPNLIIKLQNTRLPVICVANVSITGYILAIGRHHPCILMALGVFYG